MKDIILIYLNDNLSDLDLTVAENFSPNFIEKSVSASSIMQNFDVFYSLPEKYKGKLEEKQNLRRKEDVADGWISLFETKKCENIIKISAEAMFIDKDVVDEMYSIHTKYQAEFTYCENLPEGLTCEIYSSELVSLIPDGDKRLPIASVIKANINQFDVELFYKSPDIRDKRISFKTSNKRDNEIMNRILKINGDAPKYECIKDLIEKNPEVLYIAPAYYEVELSAKRNAKTICSPLNNVAINRKDMSLEMFESIVKQADGFGYNYAISLAGLGDPINNESFFEAVDFALSAKNLEMLVVETNATFDDKGIFEWLKKKNDERIKFIVEVNGFDNDTYKKIHNEDCFDKVKENVLELKKVLNDKCLYLQIMKIKETEELLDKYYDFWEKEGLQIILMKQNVYLNLCEDRRYYDLSPLDRIPCWHLQRDMFILCDGVVPFCKQDIEGKVCCGVVGKNSLNDIWQNRKEIFINDYKKSLSKKINCAQCDEWFTFNN